jgi:hypothetical protein
MKIILSPVASNKTTLIQIDGLILSIDGVDYDLSEIPLGGQAESDDGVFIGLITRDCVTLKYEYESNLAYPDQSININDYVIDIEKGEIPSPIKWKKDL